MAFQCVVVTPEQQAFDARVTQAIVPAHDGLIGILDGRAPILMKIGVGPLRLDLPDRTQQFFLIDGGVAQMKDEVLTILTDRAIAASEIDAESARAEFNEAVARRITDDHSFEERARAIQRAQTKMALGK